MPIHDWTRVRANRFHDFVQGWTVALSDRLNAGHLPPGYFALLESRRRAPKLGLARIELDPPTATAFASAADAMAPPRSRFVVRANTDAFLYARKVNRVTVRHPDGTAVAVVEIVSPGNKGSRHALRGFARKAAAFLRAGIHLLVIDLFPPGPRDPQGIHPIIWDRLQEEPFALPADQPLTLAAYAAGAETVAYVEPVAVGDALPDMPLFLTADRYVPCPLDETYQAAWAQFPAPLRGPLEAPPG